MPTLQENLSTLPRHPSRETLLDAAIDPHPRKTRRIEWIGEKSPFDDDVLVAMMLMNYYTPTQKKAIRLAAAKALTRVDQYRIRMLEAGSHSRSLAPTAHLHRTYEWSFRNGFVQDVDYRDVDTILGGPDGHEFVDITDREPDEPPAFVKPSPEAYRLIAQDVYGTNDVRLTIGQVVASN